MRLISDIDVIQAIYGVDPVKQLLFTNIRLDSRRFVTPMLVDDQGERRLLARQQEMGNLFSSGINPQDVVFYEPWVTIDKRITEGVSAYPKFVDAVVSLANENVVELDKGIALTHYQALDGKVPLRVERNTPQRVRAYALKADDVLAWFSAQRQEAAEVAANLLAGIPHLSPLQAELTSDADTRFDALDALASDLGVDGFFLSSPPNYSEVTALAASEECFAVRLNHSDQIILIGSEDCFSLPGVPVGDFDSLGAAVAAVIPGKRIGVEEQWIPASLGLDLRDAGLQMVNASVPLGGWRDIRDCEDLSFQMICARASVECIEEALSYAELQIGAGNTLTENDVFAKYVELIHEFRRKHSIPFAIEPYFTNLHSSSRMLFPGPPTDYVLNETTKCVQLDAGVKLTINGVVLATSDMARSLLRTPEGKEAYGILTDIVRDVIIGAIKPGVVCEQVHERTMEAMVHIRESLEGLGMLSPEVDFVTEYRKRNVGHLMGKQESFANELRPGYSHVLAVGSLGAAEIPWRFGDYAIGTEDMWYIGKEQTFNITLRS